MATIIPPPAMAGRLVAALHTEVLLLADEGRSYFGGPGRAERDALDPRARVLFACEALKATTRTMQLLAWLGTQRAGGAPGPLAPDMASDPATLALLPTAARRLILAGIELYQRAGRLAEGEMPAMASVSPARRLMERLERAF